MELQEGNRTPCGQGEHVGKTMLFPGSRQIAKKEKPGCNESGCRPTLWPIPQVPETEDEQRRKVKKCENGEYIFTGGPFRRLGRDG